MDFTAVRDFFSPETNSQYAAGMSYTARDPASFSSPLMDAKSVSVIRGRMAKLIEVLPSWIADGRVVVGRPAVARLTGSAELTPPEPSAGGEA